MVIFQIVFFFSEATLSLSQISRQTNRIFGTDQGRFLTPFELKYETHIHRIVTCRYKCVKLFPTYFLHSYSAHVIVIIVGTIDVGMTHTLLKKSNDICTKRGFIDWRQKFTICPIQRSRTCNISDRYTGFYKLETKVYNMSNIELKNMSHK